MHPNSYAHMEEKVQQHLSDLENLSIVDIGSQDVNGSFKPIFNKKGWIYKGLDACPGNNVDIILSDPYSLPLPDKSVDVVISGSAFEHIEFFWLTWEEICRITKSGGYIILVVPSKGPEHRYPIDAWRFYPDAMSALARLTKIELVSAHTDWEDNGRGGCGLWGDTVGVFKIP